MIHALVRGCKGRWGGGGKKSEEIWTSQGLVAAVIRLSHDDVADMADLLDT